ncbi:MAG: hypothetical protein ACR2FG_14810 [Marmoricola sp.]
MTVLDFQLRGRPGSVRVRYGVNDDPARWGYPLLRIDSLVELSRGFPVVQAEVEHDAQGYAAMLAWIQLVRMTDLDSGESSTLVDGAPQLEGLDLPYVSFGVRPILFDAPSTTTRNADWDADAFLVVTPDALMTRRVQPLCGFGWGYRVRDGEPAATRLQELDAASWRRDRDFLAEQHPSWTFEDQTDETLTEHR